MFNKMMALAGGFFSSQFNRGNPKGHFKSLEKVTTQLGGTAYNTVFAIAFFALLIALVLGGAYLAMSDKGASREMAKKRVMRVAIIAMLVTSLYGVVNVVISIFAW